MHGVFGLGAGAAGAGTPPSGPIMSLPDEMIEYIANFLAEDSDRTTMLAVCKRWQVVLLKVEKPTTIPELSEQSRKFKEITRAITEMGCFEGAVGVARRLRYGWQQGDSFFAISKELANQGRIKEALLVANKISTLSGDGSSSNVKILKDLQATALTIISGKLIETDIKQAIQVAHSITDRSGDKSRAFIVIAIALRRGGDEAGALKIEKLISHKTLKKTYLASQAV